MPPKHETTAVAEETGEVLDSAASPETEQVDANPSDEGQSAIPDKFAGKTPEEIARSYRELESAYSRVSGETAQLKRQNEEYQARLADREADMRSRQPVSPAPEAADPFQTFEKQWEAGDPKTAVKTAVQTVSEQIQQGLLAKEGRDFYQRQRTENQDFQKREPDMVNLARRYGHLINPKFADSREAYEVLHLAARGLRVADYVKDEVEKTKQSSKTVRAEKQKAFSETGSSAESAEDVFADLPLDQMRAKLARSGE